MEKSVLEGFSLPKDKGKVQEFYSEILNIITSALDEIQSEQNFTTLNEESTRIFPIGDYTNDTFIDENGELEVVIASSNPQLALANKTFVKNIAEARSKKAQNTISNDGTFDKFIIAFASSLAGYFDEKTAILLVNEGIKVFCYKEYSFKLLIRFATYSENDENAILTFWNPLLRQTKEVDLFLYNENMEKKNEETHGNYKKLVRIYKNLRKTLLINKWASGNEINKYFVELIIFNIPNELLQDKDIDMVFTKSFNYLTNCNVLNFKSFDGKSLQTFMLAKISTQKVIEFINLLSKVVI